MLELVYEAQLDRLVANKKEALDWLVRHLEAEATPAPQADQERSPSA